MEEGSLQRELVEHGHAPGEARAEALRRFGSPERVEGECLGIHLGGRLMLQRMHFIVTLLLLAAVVALFLSNLAFQRRSMGSCPMPAGSASRA